MSKQSNPRRNIPGSHDLGTIDEDDYALLEEVYSGRKRTPAKRTRKETAKVVETADKPVEQTTLHESVSTFDDTVVGDDSIVEDDSIEQDDSIVEDDAVEEVDKEEVEEEQTPPLPPKPERKRKVKLAQAVETRDAPPKEDKSVITVSGDTVAEILKEIPDHLTVGKVKPKDKALNALLEKVRLYLSTRSHLDDLEPTTTMAEVKNVIRMMSEGDRQRILNVYTDERYGDMDAERGYQKLLQSVQEHPKAAGLIGLFLILAILGIVSSFTGNGNDNLFNMILDWIATLLGIGGDSPSDLRVQL